MSDVRPSQARVPWLRLKATRVVESESDPSCCQAELVLMGLRAPQETHNVAEVREKIKNFLASYGMIKGHTGAVLPRDSDVLPTLRLSGDASDSSESPSTPTLSLCSDSLSSDGIIAGHTYTLSSARDEHLWSDATTAQEYQQSGQSPYNVLRFGRAHRFQACIRQRF